jgi:hypothetical protein
VPIYTEVLQRGDYTANRHVATIKQRLRRKDRDFSQLGIRRF